MSPPPISSPAAASQRRRQPFIVFRELASAPPLPQPPATHAHPAHTSIWPTEEPREVCGHMLIFIWAVINTQMYLHSSKNSEQNQRSFKEEQLVLHIMDPHAECVGRRDVQKHMQRPFVCLDLFPLQMFHTETLMQHRGSLRWCVIVCFVFTVQRSTRNCRKSWNRRVIWRSTARWDVNKS